MEKDYFQWFFETFEGTTYGFQQDKLTHLLIMLVAWLIYCANRHQHLFCLTSG